MTSSMVCAACSTGPLGQCVVRLKEQSHAETRGYTQYVGTIPASQIGDSSCTGCTGFAVNNAKTYKVENVNTPHAHITNGLERVGRRRINTPGQRKLNG